MGERGGIDHSWSDVDFIESERKFVRSGKWRMPSFGRRVSALLAAPGLAAACCVVSVSAAAAPDLVVGRLLGHHSSEPGMASGDSAGLAIRKVPAGAAGRDARVSSEKDGDGSVASLKFWSAAPEGDGGGRRARGGVAWATPAVTFARRPSGARAPVDQQPGLRGPNRRTFSILEASSAFTGRHRADSSAGARLR
jgi:hypothetical protein